MMDEYTPTDSDWDEYVRWFADTDAFQERDEHLATCKAGCFCPICEGEHNDRI